MKIARSEGGPFIIMDSTLALSWGGVMHKGFMDHTYDGASDYDSLCTVLKRPEYIQKEMVVITSRLGQVLILGRSFEAAILLDSPARVCIVQAHYSDPEWSAGDLDRSVLDLPTQQDSDFAEMKFNGSELVIFDSTCGYDDFRDEAVYINMTSGYVYASYTMHYPDERTLISVADLRVR